jgi:hypothetical protein
LKDYKTHAKTEVKYDRSQEWPMPG